MVNTARGEVALQIDGERYVLCLTLGALAEIEALFDGAVETRLKTLGARDLLAVLLALLRGGGHAISEAELRASRLDLNAAARAVAACFEAAL
ncbi:MAG: GTA-gp10 family protein [Maricaulis sp.]|jgi:hypothetical protein|nr:GTA-gp10 family protein [Maricaulis sp.]